MARSTWSKLARRSTLASMAGVVSLLLAPPAHAEPGNANATVHVVQPGETLSQIADSVGVDAAALATLNGLDDLNLVSIGQPLKVPANVASAGAAPPSGSAVASASPSASGPAASAVAPSTRRYAVADGDTLGGIAQQLTTTTAALVNANTLQDADQLVVGTQLVVPAATGVRVAAPGSAPTGSPAPAPAPPPTSPPSATAPAAAVPAKPSLLRTYTVQAGETLNQIARQFDLRPDVIAQASGLDDPNHISVGSVLKLPLPGREHLVAQGETLRDIAAQEKVDLGSLIDFNQIDDPELIRVGQVVLVPAAPSQQAASSGASVASAPAPGAKAVAASPPGAPAPAAAPASPAAPASSANKAGAAAAPPKPKPAAPLAVVPPPPGAPTDGLAVAALKFLGAAYVWGGSSPAGFDCSGFVWYVARQAGQPLSRGMLGEYNSGGHPGRDELKAGDLVFFQNTYSAGLSHAGVYIGNDQFVHAADEAAGVTISNLGTAYWSSHWFGATRLS